MPLVIQAFNWGHGVFLGATSPPRHGGCRRQGRQVRRDPMAMLPFCGYNMGDYFAHWLRSAAGDPQSAPDLPRQLVPQGRERQVPLAGLRREHARAQVDLRAPVRRRQGPKTPIGNVPTKDALDLDGLDISDERPRRLLLSVDTEAWKREAALIPDHLRTFGEHLPSELWDKYQELLDRLG